MGDAHSICKKGVCSRYVALSVIIPVVRGIISEESHSSTRGVQPNNCTVLVSMYG
jgi:hypothetical protein